MRRYIVLLLITGILWAQTDFDTLILKNGTTYLGEYSKIEGKIVYFKPQDVFALHGFSVNLIQTLKLKDGHFIIEDGKNFEEYQKLSTKEKAIYDAKSQNLSKWALYMPTSIIIFWGSTFLHKGLTGGGQSPIFLAGSSAASLTIPYFVLNRKENFNFPKSIMTDSEKEIYKQTYSNKLSEIKFKYVVGSCFCTCVIVALMGMAVVDGLKPSSGFFKGGSTHGYW